MTSLADERAASGGISNARCVTFCAFWQRIQAAFMSCNGCSEKDIEDFGFERKEMFSTPLAGTLERYDGHIFVPLKQPPSEWPSDALGVTTENGLAIGALLNHALKAAMKKLPEGTPKMRVTPCHALPSDEEGDVIYFPPRFGDRVLP